MYYSTIQTADIDGDGESEVLARWIDGLSIYRFENGTLLNHSRISALSDNAGFYEPSLYSTIHTAVLDRKLGQADVIARERDGIHVFRYDATQHQWRELGSHARFRPFADKDADGTDWTQPKHYLTIQLADLTGDGVAELVGRGQNGMQVWQWKTADERWAQTSAGGELSDSQGFDQEPYYYSISWSMSIMTVVRNSWRVLRPACRPINGTIPDGRWSAPMADSGTMPAFSKVSATNRCGRRSMPPARLGCTALRSELETLAPVRFRFIDGAKTTGSWPKLFLCRAPAGIEKASLRR
jgi:hypothetical protein